MATVSIFMPEMSLTTGNVLWLRKSSDYSVVNAGGDALTESGTSGWFTATVAETWTEQLSVTVVDTNGLIPRTGWLTVGGTIVVEGTAVLDSAVTTQLGQMQDGIGWLLTERVGAVANPQNAAALCQLTIWGDDYTVQYSGLTNAGVRSTTTLGKT
jgi:hypothetical protein